MNLSKLKIIGDGLVYDGTLRGCRCFVVDDDGKKYSLIADVCGDAGKVIKKLLKFYKDNH